MHNKFNRVNHFRNMDLFLNSLMNEVPALQNNGNMHFPAVNIIESGEEYLIEFNVPGRKKEDFKISVDKAILTVSYEKKEENKEEAPKFLKREFKLQSFKKSFTLDEKIDADAISARYEAGILMIGLPKKEEVKVLPKEISIS